jgi:hypothetical protein
MKKVLKALGITLASILLVIFILQIRNVGAIGNDPITGPITNPITSPISLTPTATPTATVTPTVTLTLTPTPTCKPGNGFGDKNHCHSGPPGQVGK